MLYLNPVTWLSLLSGLSRPMAAVAFVTCLTMLALGLRGFRYYLCVALAGLAFVGGTKLATLMAVKDWHVGLPAGVIALFLAWPLSGRIAVVLLGFGSACATALFVTQGLDYPGYFWPGFAGGALVGILFAVFAPRFSTAMFCAGVGAAGVIASLGPLVRAESGPFAVGGYARYPLPFLATGTVLFLLAMVLQVALDPDTERALATGV